ncbi:MAG TPA: AMP-binding protein [Xanthobacteraceae bacterium]|nr:AMP-binding protein [Xanthobacteraceae bacterium]
MAIVQMSAIPRFHAARKGTGAPVLTHDGRTVSWGELEARANRRARLFASSGVKAGDFVTIALPNGNEFYETTFAVWKLGATPNPVPSKLPRTEFSAIIDLVRPALVVGGEEQAVIGFSRLPGDADASSFSSDPGEEPLAASWKAMTSGGSTGRPKVIVDRRPAAWDTEAFVLQQQTDEVILNPGPLYHNAPFLVTHLSLMFGGHVVGMRRFDPLEALRLIDAYKVSWVNLVPTMMHRIWSLPAEKRANFDVSSLRIVFHMASPMPPWLKQAWIDWLGPERIWELYGGTERQGATIINGVEWLEHRGSVGRIQGEDQLKIFNEQGGECKPGEVGEIFFKSAEGQGSTYYYLGAQAKEREGGWESIGDMGWMDEEGYVYIADRRTDLILRGGANIYPAEVEAALDAHPDVGSSVVIGLPDDEMGQRVHAIVQPKLDAVARLNAADLQRFLDDRIVRYKIPESYEFTNDCLRDDAGKVRRSALREERVTWLREGREFRVDTATPRNPGNSGHR